MSDPSYTPCDTPLRFESASSLSLFFNDAATTEIYTLSLHDALPISAWQDATGKLRAAHGSAEQVDHAAVAERRGRSEEHTSELQSLRHLVCRLLLEKKNSMQNHGALNEPVPCIGRITRLQLI